MLATDPGPGPARLQRVRTAPGDSIPPVHRTASSDVHPRWRMPLRRLPLTRTRLTLCFQYPVAVCVRSRVCSQAYASFKLRSLSFTASEEERCVNSACSRCLSQCSTRLVFMLRRIPSVNDSVLMRCWISVNFLSAVN